MFNSELFFAEVRKKFDGLKQTQVDGYNIILGEARKRNTPTNKLADILATTYWETGHTMQPVREAFWKNEAWRKANLRYYPAYGRGYLQLTWPANYKKADDKLGLGGKLVADYDLAMDPTIAVQILFQGMEEGWFTGKRLSDYIDDIDEPDTKDLAEFIASRRIINGTDHAAAIGQLGLFFEHTLRAAGYDPTVIPQVANPQGNPPEPIPSTAADTTKTGVAAAAGVVVVGGLFAGVSHWLVAAVVVAVLATVAFFVIRKRWRAK